ncbi:hypothetical protein AB4254_11920 [Vibrio breoganii]
MQIYSPQTDSQLYLDCANEIISECVQNSIIGEGNFGICFKISDRRAAKITCDKGEVAAAIITMAQPNDALPNVYSIKKTSNPSLYIIEQDLCTKLDDSEYAFIDDALSTFHSEYEDEFEDPSLTTAKAFNELVRWGSLNYLDNDAFAIELNRAVSTASEHALLDILDFHLDNVMRHNNSLVLIDQKAQSPTPDDSKRIDNIINRFFTQHKKIEPIQACLP